MARLILAMGLDPSDTQSVFNENHNAPHESHDYIHAAVDFLYAELGMPKDEIFRNLQNSNQTIFPARARYKHWGSFPDTKKETTKKVCPAADHYIITKEIVLDFLNNILDTQEATKYQDKARNLLYGKRDWGYELYTYCSNASSRRASIGESAIYIITKLICVGIRVAIMTNSKPEKAKKLLEAAGFTTQDISEYKPWTTDAILIVGNAQKYAIDTNWKIPGSDVIEIGNGYQIKNNQLDLSRNFHDPQAIVNVQRPIFFESLKKLRNLAGPNGKLIFVSDIPELDLIPAMAFSQSLGGIMTGLKVHPDTPAKSHLSYRLITQESSILDAPVSSNIYLLIHMLIPELILFKLPVTNPIVLAT